MVDKKLTKNDRYRLDRNLSHFSPKRLWLLRYTRDLEIKRNIKGWGRMR